MSGWDRLGLNATRRNFNGVLAMIRWTPRRPGLFLFSTLLVVVWNMGAMGSELVVRSRTPLTGPLPIVVELAQEIKPGPYLLKRGEVSIPATVFEDAGKTYLGTVLAGLENVAEQRLTIEPRSDMPAHVVLQTSGARVKVLVGSSVFTEYIPDDGPKPYLFPLVGPTGAKMTRSYPMVKVEGEKYDHPHHRSLWFTHGKLNNVDFWSEAAGHGTIKTTSLTTNVSGAVGRLRTTDVWQTQDGKKVCDDERVLTFYATPTERIVDVDVTIKATAGPLVFGDTKEGMFGLRVPTSMDVTSKLGGKITNADGLTDAKTWGKPSSWVDYTGPVEGKTLGITVMNHPSSFRYPTTWHVREYGLFAANPFGWHDFGLGKGGLARRGDRREEG